MRIVSSHTRHVIDKAFQHKHPKLIMYPTSMMTHVELIITDPIWAVRWSNIRSYENDCNSTNRNDDSPKCDAGVPRLCLPIPGHLVELQHISDEEPRRRAAVTVHDAVLAGHIGAAPWQLAPVGGLTEPLVARDRAPARGRLGVVERQV